MNAVPVLRLGPGGDYTKDITPEVGKLTLEQYATALALHHQRTRSQWTDRLRRIQSNSETFKPFSSSKEDQNVANAKTKMKNEDFPGFPEKLYVQKSDERGGEALIIVSCDETDDGEIVAVYELLHIARVTQRGIKELRPLQ